MWHNKPDTKFRANAKSSQLEIKRAVYDKQFKLAAVKHTQSTDQSVSEAAKTLGISGSTLRRWINEYNQHGDSLQESFAFGIFIRQFYKDADWDAVLCNAWSGD